MLWGIFFLCVEAVHLCSCFAMRETSAVPVFMLVFYILLFTKHKNVFCDIGPLTNIQSFSFKSSSCPLFDWDNWIWYILYTIECTIYYYI